MSDLQVNSLEEAEQYIRSLLVRVRELERLVRLHEDNFDTFVETPWWKRFIFMVDGWPLYRLTDKPAWRPWRRWWTS